MQSLVALFAFVALARAGTDWGTVETRDWPITYDTTYADTTTFCKAWRLACIDYVGTRNYHHGIECELDQPGPTVETVCLGVEKQADGDYGTGPDYDFTTFVIATFPGAVLAGSPEDPTTPYAGDGVATSSSDSASSSSTDAATSTDSYTDTSSWTSSSDTSVPTDSSSSSSWTDSSSTWSSADSTGGVLAVGASSASSVDVVTVTGSGSASSGTPTSSGLSVTHPASASITVVSDTSSANQAKSIAAAFALMVISTSLLLLS